ncbi:MAG: hypothetical protein ACFFAJ_16405 [Candidatus Hodarchaeota archaeon]
MNSGEDFQVADTRPLTLLKQIWGVWTFLTVVPALFLGIPALFLGILYLPTFLRSPTEEVYIGFSLVPAYSAVFACIIGIGIWVLFLGNIYITIGLARLDYFRWKLLVIDSGLSGIVLGLVSLIVIIDLGYNLQDTFLQNLIRILRGSFLGLGGTGCCLVLLYLAFNVRDKFRKT